VYEQVAAFLIWSIGFKGSTMFLTAIVMTSSLRLKAKREEVTISVTEDAHQVLSSLGMNDIKDDGLAGRPAKRERARDRYAGLFAGSNSGGREA
jgi:hypothetical protein